jgi:hypothetical protein
MVRLLEIIPGRQRSRAEKVGSLLVIWSANVLEQTQSIVEIEIFIGDNCLV